LFIEKEEVIFEFQEVIIELNVHLIQWNDCSVELEIQLI